MPYFPSMCQFCDSKFLSPSLSNCCPSCYKIYLRHYRKFKDKTRAKMATRETVKRNLKREAAFKKTLNLPPLKGE